MKDGRRHYLGSFSTAEAAALAYARHIATFNATSTEAYARCASTAQCREGEKGEDGEVQDGEGVEGEEDGVSEEDQEDLKGGVGEVEEGEECEVSEEDEVVRVPAIGGRGWDTRGDRNHVIQVGVSGSGGIGGRGRGSAGGGSGRCGRGRVCFPPEEFEREDSTRPDSQDTSSIRTLCYPACVQLKARAASPATDPLHARAKRLRKRPQSGCGGDGDDDSIEEAAAIRQPQARAKSALAAAPSEPLGSLTAAQCTVEEPRGHGRWAELSMSKVPRWFAADASVTATDQEWFDEYFEVLGQDERQEVLGQDVRLKTSDIHSTLCENGYPHSSTHLCMWMMGFTYLRGYGRSNQGEVNVRRRSRSACGGDSEAVQQHWGILQGKPRRSDKPTGISSSMEGEASAYGHLRAGRLTSDTFSPLQPVRPIGCRIQPIGAAVVSDEKVSDVELPESGERQLSRKELMAREACVDDDDVVIICERSREQRTAKGLSEAIDLMSSEDEADKDEASGSEADECDEPIRRSSKARIVHRRASRVLVTDDDDDEVVSKSLQAEPIAADVATAEECDERPLSWKDLMAWEADNAPSGAAIANAASDDESDWEAGEAAEAVEARKVAELRVDCRNGRLVDGDDDDDDDLCWTCCSPGELLCCDGDECGAQHHIHCIGLRKVPQGDWLCQACKQSRRSFLEAREILSISRGLGIQK